MNPSALASALGALNADASHRPGNDPIFALHAEATARAQAGESILNATLGALLTNETELAVMSSASEAFVAVPAARAAAYAPIAGTKPFRRAVIESLVGSGTLADQAEAVATAGATGALHHAIANFVDPGEAVLTTSYFWGPYRALAEHAGKRITTFEMFDVDGAFNTAAFRQGIEDLVAEQGRALVLLNFPCHNPTGYSLDDGEWRAVAEVVRDVGRHAPVSLLIDYAYGAFGFGGHRYVDRPSADNARDRHRALRVDRIQGIHAVRVQSGGVGCAAPRCCRQRGHGQRTRVLVSGHMVELQPQRTAGGYRAPHQARSGQPRRLRASGSDRTPQRPRRGIQRGRLPHRHLLPALRGRVLRLRVHAG